MSRIGKMPVDIPSGVKVEVKGQEVSVTGKKGSLTRTVRPEMTVKVDGNQVIVEGNGDKKINAFRGMTRSLINNMVIGVDQGFKKVLVIEGVGYRASASGKKLTLSVGYSNPVEFQLPEAVSGNVDNSTTIILESIDKEALGMTAAQIREIRKPEPYKGKGIRYEGEYIQRKAGKTGAAAAA